MPLKTWSAAGIITAFVQEPQRGILMTTADMNSWLLNTENTVTIPPNVYIVVFQKRGQDVWQASLKFDYTLKIDRRLRFK